ncbi:DUF6541 family protein [Actinomyces ruminis]|uniref:L-lactate permease n=1 Tax=Actinomyces ruminis TaxID=1937003 RepID=A0ABX4MAC5_9ACTO|nr:DUF6541 family protein [Actinomyces ruminis]PHP52397.1 hypothetical protein BW737_009550 [Actinomyces ruminis]
MIAWGALVLAAVGISLLVVLPGMLLLAGSGADRSLALAAGPAVTVAIAGVAAVVFSRFGIVWDARTVGGLFVLLGSIGIAGVRLRGSTVCCHGLPLKLRAPLHSIGERTGWSALAASIIGAVTAGGTQIILFAKTIGTPWAMLQNTDAMVQLNLIEEIHRSGDASMLTAAIPVTGGSYPTVWHSFAVFLTPFASTPFTFNALLVSLFGVLYPTGMAMLATAAGGGPIARVAAPWLALSAPWFPGFMLTFSSMTSAGFAVALVPSAIAAVVLLWRSYSTGDRCCLWQRLCSASGWPVQARGSGRFWFHVCCCSSDCFHEPVGHGPRLEELLL